MKKAASKKARLELARQFMPRSLNLTPEQFLKTIDGNKREIADFRLGSVAFARSACRSFEKKFYECVAKAVIGGNDDPLKKLLRAIGHNEKTSQ